ncbi:hypothetical protein ACX1C1_18980 [Paenibacillus sp. strain BS8-2]
MNQPIDIGQIPTSLSFICAALTLLIPLLFNWLIRTTKKNGEPPWKQEEKQE